MKTMGKLANIHKCDHFMASLCNYVWNCIPVDQNVHSKLGWGMHEIEKCYCITMYMYVPL